MRNLPRIALVPLAVLVSAIPFTFSAFVSPAGAETAADCDAAFASPAASGFTYTTDPAVRLAYVGDSVSLSGAWDPSAWDSLTSAIACVQVDDGAFDETLGAVQAGPVNGGVFSHSFTIPEGTEPGTRLCTRMRLAGDPAGDATEAVWVSKEHCYEVDHHEAEAPPAEEETTTTTSAPPTTVTTVPTAAPANSQGTPADQTPAPNPPVVPEGGGSPTGTPFDAAGEAPGPGVPVAPPGRTAPEALPLLPATGYASLDLLHQGELCLSTGLALLVLAGRRRRSSEAA